MQIDDLPLAGNYLFSSTDLIRVTFYSFTNQLLLKRKDSGKGIRLYLFTLPHTKIDGKGI